MPKGKEAEENHNAFDDGPPPLLSVALTLEVSNTHAEISLLDIGRLLVPFLFPVISGIKRHP